LHIHRSHCRSNQSDTENRPDEPSEPGASTLHRSPTHVSPLPIAANSTVGHPELLHEILRAEKKGHKDLVNFGTSNSCSSQNLAFEGWRSAQERARICVTMTVPPAG
jgi:hypothetical protein